MRKKIIIGIIIATFTLVGCQVSSDQFLSFHAFKDTERYATDNRVTEGEFFAKNLVVITDDENIGSDTELISKAALLVNVSDKEVLYANNVYEKLYPASLTKLLTALVVFEYAELTDMVTISYNASHIPDGAAKKCGFEEGDVINLEVLLHSLLIYSGNDAGIAIAEHVGGSEEGFAKKMNEEAKLIGAVDTNFVNSHGLHDDNHYTTAYDIYLMFNKLIESDKFRSIINSESYTAIYVDKNGNEKQKKFDTTNRFLKGDEEAIEGIEVIGGKTGTTYKAGNCLILLCRDDKEKNYIGLILKAASSDSLYSEMSHLLTFMNKD